jgi:hypothetical protein
MCQRMIEDGLTLSDTFEVLVMKVLSDHLHISLILLVGAEDLHKKYNIHKDPIMVFALPPHPHPHPLFPVTLLHVLLLFQSQVVEGHLPPDLAPCPFVYPDLILGRRRSNLSTTT